MDPRPGRLKPILQVGITSVFISALTALVAPWMAWKALLSFIPLWIGFEILYRARVRSIAACQYCGFDPFLYLSDAQRAKQAIQAHLKKRYEEKGLEYPNASNHDANGHEEEHQS
jgi:hypothetical protein